MLHTTLVKDQFVKIGEAIVYLKEIKDLTGKPKVVLSIEAPKEIKIQFDQTKRTSIN